MKKKMLLGSCLHLVIGRMGFVFEKPQDQLTVICITTAANVYAPDKKDWLHQEMKAFTDMGIVLTEFDIQNKTQTEVAEKIKDANVVYVTGGNSYFLMEHMQKCNFKSVISSYLQNGGFYIGCSAGTIVTCPTVDFIRDMDDPAKANLTDYSGLGLIDFKIMPHIDHPKYTAKAKAIIDDLKLLEDPIFGLKDNQAILIQDNYIEIF